MLQKVLISAPTASIKNYCFDEWIENVSRFTYPSFEVVLFDNTDDGGENAIYLNETYKKTYGNIGKFTCLKSETNNQMDVMERLAVSHNDSRNYCINGGYNYLLHLETDVLPETDVIERLLSFNKNIVGGLYYIDEGIGRSLMAQQYIYRGYMQSKGVNFSPKDDSYFIDGSLKQVFHIGLGCILIKKPILNKIVFRSQKGVFQSPDGYFAQDCKANGLDIYCDTSLICKHKNGNWDKQLLKTNYKL